MKFLNNNIKILIISISCLVASGIWTATKIWTEQSALKILFENASLVARQQARLIDSELAKFRLLPIVLKEYNDLQGILDTDSKTATTRLNLKLDFLAREIGSPIIYVIKNDGTVIASSNADSPESFIGRNYGFRPYFNRALEAGSAEYYAIGDLSGRFGLFLARRIGDEAAPKGVVVVKFEFNRLISTWSHDSGETFVVDPSGIILASTVEAENLLSFNPIKIEELEKIRQSGQFKNAVLQESHYSIETDQRMLGPSGETYAMLAEPIAGTELKLLHIEATAQAFRSAQDHARIVTIAVWLILLIFTSAIYWRITRAARAAADKAALERAVTERTAELRSEIAERERSDRRFRDAREELAQANRLASLGSITAGLVHEINQPVATIQTLAENAQHHLHKNNLKKVATNLSATIELTSRIGSITQEMRRFARRGKTDDSENIYISEIIEGTSLIMGDSFRNARVKLEVSAYDDIMILANRVRLEQVLVNLLQNALDAIVHNLDPQVALYVSSQDEIVTITVADNGPGLNPTLKDDIFKPFISGKPEGLGLGLGIARDIMNDLGGSLHFVPSPLGGAAFAATVKRA